MNANGRAEKIIDRYDGNTFSNAGQATAWLKDAITTQIKEAERDVSLLTHGCTAEGATCPVCIRQYADGFKAAQEQAASIAEYHSGPSIQLAERIREIKP